jgi:predicted nucleic acid-binding protein
LTHPALLIDTDVAIDIVRRFPPAPDWLGSIRGHTLLASGFTAMELLSGCKNSAEQQLANQVIRLLGLKWPSRQRCSAALELYRSTRLSQGIGLIDCLIAQTALALDLPLLTFNEKHFRVVPGLQKFQPYSRSR